MLTSPRKRRGYTLIESLITIMVIGVMLLIVSQMVRDMQNETVMSQDNDRRLSAHLTLDRISQALHSCQSVVAPVGVGTSTATLRLKSFNPAQDVTRLPLTLLPPGSLWSPRDSADMMENKFQVVNGDLLCIHVLPGGVQQEVFLFADAETFSVQSLANRRYKLSLGWRTTMNRAAQISRLSRDSFAL